MLPELVGGSADLTGSNLTMVKASKPVSPESVSGNHIFYGVREFGMCAMMSGITLHGGFIPYGGTFLSFPTTRATRCGMAALMKIRVVYVFTHDSIGLGEDGPTHQPIEHAATLRLIPNMDVWRPSDTVETAVAWAAALRARTARLRCCSAVKTSPLPKGPRSPASSGAATSFRTPRKRGRSSLPPGRKCRSRSGRKSCSPTAASRCAWCRCPRTSLFDRQDADYRPRSCRRVCRR